MNVFLKNIRDFPKTGAKVSRLAVKSATAREEISESGDTLSANATAPGCNTDYLLS